MIVTFTANVQRQINAIITTYARGNGMSFKKRPSFVYKDNDKVLINFVMDSKENDRRMLDYLANRADFRGFSL